MKYVNARYKLRNTKWNTKLETSTKWNDKVRNTYTCERNVAEIAVGRRSWTGLTQKLISERAHFNSVQFLQIETWNAQKSMAFVLRHNLFRRSKR